MQTLTEPPPALSSVPALSKTHPIEPSIVAAFVTALTLGAGGAVLALLPLRGNAPLVEMFTPEHVALLRMVDNSTQRLAYRVALGALALLCVVSFLLVARRPYELRMAGAAAKAGGVFRRYGGLLVVVVAAGALLQSQLTIYGLNPDHRAWWDLWLISAVAMGLVLMHAPLLAGRYFAVAACLFIGGYVLYLSTPGFVYTPFLPEPVLTWSQWHYSVTLAQGDRLSAGLLVGEHITLNYGLLHQAALAAWEKAFGLLDYGSHIRIVQVSQIVFLLLATTAFYLWRPRNWLFLVFATLMVGPWMSTIQSAVLYPNQSGWRALGFAAGLIALLLVRGQPLGRAALMLGACGAALIVYSPEIGICVTAGYGVYLLSRLRRLSISGAGSLVARGLVGAAGVTIAFLVLYVLAFGGLPTGTITELLGFITRFTQGYGSLPLYYDPLALLIFANAAYVVALTALRWRARELTTDESIRAAISVIILIWSSYFINRPASWNLWTFHFLYVFIIADAFDPSFLRAVRQRGILAFMTPWVAILAFIVLPHLLAQNYYNLTNTANLQPGPPGTEIVSGVALTGVSAARLREQAGFLAEHEESSSLFFTHHSYLMSLLTGRFMELPVQDAFAETVTTDDYSRLVGRINEISPRTILFDVPASNPEPAVILGFYDSFYERVKRSLAERYELKGVTSGWQVWELRGP